MSVASNPPLNHTDNLAPGSVYPSTFSLPLLVASGKASSTGGWGGRKSSSTVDTEEDPPVLPIISTTKGNPHLSKTKASIREKIK